MGLRVNCCYLLCICKKKKERKSSLHENLSLFPSCKRFSHGLKCDLLTADFNVTVGGLCWMSVGKNFVYISKESGRGLIYSFLIFLLPIQQCGWGRCWWRLTVLYSSVSLCICKVTPTFEWSNHMIWLKPWPHFIKKISCTLLKLKTLQLIFTACVSEHLPTYTSSSHRATQAFNQSWFSGHLT